MFVIGYNLITRGVSVRSNRRVPTHLVLALGKGMSIDKMAQAMGRATYGNGKALLEPFGGHVIVLTYAQDFDSAQAYPHLLQEVKNRVVGGKSIQDALSSDAAEYPDKANVMSNQARSIGLKKANLTKRVEAPFAEPVEGEERTGQKALKKRRRELLEDDVIAKLLLQVAGEHFRESVADFNEYLRNPALQPPGGTAEDFVRKANCELRMRPNSEDTPELILKTVRPKLRELCKANYLLSAADRYPEFGGKGKPVRYYVAEEDVL